MPQKKTKVLTWSEVEDFAYNKFNVWAGNKQHKWAEYAWNKLVNAGLANYNDQIDKHMVLFRLMTLATIYNEFCYLVFYIYFSAEEASHNWLGDEELFSPIRIWQLIGQDFYRHEDISDRDYDDLLTEAFYELINSQRNKVYGALYQGFGNDWEIFVSMLATAYKDEEQNQEFTKETWQKLGVKLDAKNLDEDEENGLYWITIGMPQLTP